MMKLGIASIVAVAGAQTLQEGWVAMLNDAQEQCGDWQAPKNSYLDCSTTVAGCAMRCKDGFMFSNAEKASFDVTCVEGKWTVDESAVYSVDNFDCERITECRASGAQCTPSGAFSPLQCDTEYNCWCVDTVGTKIEGTDAGPGDANPECLGFAAPAVESPSLPAHQDWHDSCVVWAKGEWYKTFDGQFFGYKASNCQMTLLESAKGLYIYQLGLDNYGRSSYDIVHSGSKQAGRLTFADAQGNSTAFIFHGRAYGLDETVEPVELASTFKVYRQNNAVIVVDLVEQTRLVFNEDALLIRAKFNLATTGVCGSFNANSEDDITNSYGHRVTDIAEFADTWRAVCPTIPFWRSSAEGEKIAVTLTNNDKITAFVKRVESDGSKKVVAELGHHETVTIEVRTSEVFIAEDGAGYKFKINGACAFMPQEAGSVAAIEQEACNTGSFVPATTNTCNAFHPVHGSVSCQVHEGIKVCALTCETGYRSETTNLFVCNLETGEYQPSLPRGGYRYPSCISNTQKCQHLDAPINGEVTCENSDGLLRCFPTCKSGFEFSSAIPMTGFYSCTEGKWNPYPHFPECVQKTEVVDENDLGKVLGVMNLGQVNPEETGYCMTWGQHHYRTFDGKIFRFQGDCSYTLLKDVLSGSFSIEVVNDSDCKGEAKCNRSINIYIADTRITLSKNEDGEPVVTTFEGELVTVPSNFYSMHISRVADYMIVKEVANSWTLKWDGDESIFIQVDEALMGQTGGLCGVFDHDQVNDFTTRDGTTVKSVALFANSWKTSDQCLEASEETFCDMSTSNGMRKSTQAIMLCSYIMDTECKDIIDPTPYFEACKEDVCFTKNKDMTAGSMCNSMASYFRECSRHGVHVEWRGSGRCEVECPANQEYHTCGSSCAPSCFNPEAMCSDQECIDGCHCPHGTFSHDGECVAREQCPCVYGDTVFQPRERLRRDCNQCVCLGGNFHCTENECDGVCTVNKGHVSTFDGKDFDFHGECAYTLWESVTEDISLTMINHDCSGKVCGRSLIFTHEGTEVKLISGGAVHIENEPVASLPIHVGQYTIERINGEGMMISGRGGRVTFDGKQMVHFRSTAEHKNEFRGLCGNFNGDATDDFLTPEGDVEENVIEFVKKWQAEICEKSPTVDSLEPCVQYESRNPVAKQLCNIFVSTEFEKCHDLIDYAPFMHQCQQDYCTEPTMYNVCASATLYAMACAKEGIVLENWREEGKCLIPCPAGQEFQECGKACERSCGALGNKQDQEFECVETCIPSCQCIGDRVVNHDGLCVAPTECSCYWNGREFFAGESRTQDCNVCECHKGAWECTDRACEASSQICSVNAEYVQCKQPMQMTCYNMHVDRKVHPHFDYHCESGCQCLEGYVFDEETESCITSEQCPCFHGGKSYRANEQFMKDCNSCTCSALGAWSCTNEECPSTCKAYGDSHIETFDGHQFQFQGECEYVYAKVEGKFEITAANEACGSKGTVCTKSITFKVGESSIKVVRGSPITTDRDSVFTLRFAGLWVFVEAKEIGVTLMWDKGTHMMIKLDPIYKNTNVQGLCGNYDGAVLHDLVTATNIATADILQFADSWKAISTCPKPVHVKDVCALNPFRKTWSTKRCSVLKDQSGPFSKCHAHVNVDYYFKNCQYDACACDTGGECECLCTAIAAYAQACNEKGIHVSWRHQGLCPMQCDGCREYNPCVSACPLTCANIGRWDLVVEECQEVCVEGCECIDNTILSEDGTQCLKQEDCFCMEIDGVHYAEGEKIASQSDACTSCYCMHGKVECIGLPCPGHTTDGSPTTPEYTTQGPPGSPTTPSPPPTCFREDKTLCAFKCHQTCHSMSASYAVCQYDYAACVDLCKPETNVLCAEGMVLSDLKTCVTPEHCTCSLPSGEILPPGGFKDDMNTCIRSYCWNNQLTRSEIPGCRTNNCDDNGKLRTRGSKWSLGACKQCECTMENEIVCTESVCDAKPVCPLCKGVEVKAEHVGLDEDKCCDLWKCPQTCGEEKCIASECPNMPVADAIETGCPEFHAPVLKTCAENELCQWHECECKTQLCPSVDLVTPCEGGCQATQQQGTCCPVRVCQACNVCSYEDGSIALGYQRGDTWKGEHQCVDCCCDATSGVASCNDRREFCAQKPTEFNQKTHKVVSDGASECCDLWKIVEITCEPCATPTVPTCEIFYKPVASVSTVDPCCNEYKCQCAPELCHPLDDTLCADGSNPEFIQGECCMTRHCKKCTHEGQDYNVAEIWYSVDGCTVFECTSDYTVTEGPKVCNPNVMKFLGFQFPAPISCPLSEPVLTVLSPSDGQGHKCCNYGKCSPEPVEVGVCDKTITDFMPEDPVCECGYTSVVTDVEYFEYTHEKTGKIVMCPRNIKTCACTGDCPTTTDMSCPACHTATLVETCCGCQTKQCVPDDSCCTKCVDNLGNLKSSGETWFQDENECIPCVCDCGVEKCSETNCCPKTCTDTTISCEDHQSKELGAHATDLCCTAETCRCDVDKCLAHVSALGLVKTCGAGETAVKTSFKNCCEYTYGCETTTVSTTPGTPGPGTPTTPGPFTPGPEKYCLLKDGVTRVNIGAVLETSDKCETHYCGEDEEMKVKETECGTPLYPNGCPAHLIAVYGHTDPDMCCKQIINCKCETTPECAAPPMCEETQGFAMKLRTNPKKDECDCPTYSCYCDDSCCPVINVDEIECVNGYVEELAPSPCCNTYRCVSSPTTTTPGSPGPEGPTTPQPPACVDGDECSRLLGESWYDQGDVCRICNCCERGNIQCFDRYCPEVPECKFNEHLVSYKIDDCCHKYVCVAEQCAEVQCPQPECCEYFEESFIETVSEDGCCQSLKCKCDTARCALTKCAAGETHRFASTDDDCCKQVCDPAVVTTTPGTGPTTTPGSGSGESTTPGSGSGESTTPGSGSGESTTPGSGSGESTTPGSGSGESTTPGSGSGESTTPGGSGSDKTTTPGSGPTTTTPPTSEKCVNNLGEEVPVGHTWNVDRAAGKDAPWNGIPTTCFPCLCMQDGSEDCVSFEQIQSGCSASLMTDCTADQVDEGIQYHGCCPQRICTEKTCDTVDCSAYENYDCSESCLPYHTAPNGCELTGPKNCCRDKVCACDLSLCPAQPTVCEGSTPLGPFVTGMLHNCCPTYECRGDVTPGSGQTTTPGSGGSTTPGSGPSTTPPTVGKCTINGIEHEGDSTWYKDPTTQCDLCNCLDNAEVCARVAPACVAPTPCKPSQHTSVVTDSCGCETHCCTYAECAHDCEALGYSANSELVCENDQVASNKYNTCTFDKATQVYTCQETNAVVTDSCMCVQKTCVCPPTCPEKPLAVNLCGRADAVVHVVATQAGFCCPTYTCEYVNDCECEHLGNVYAPGADAWEHDCAIFNCVKTAGVCEVKSMMIVGPSPPTCNSATQVLCKTEGRCYDSFTCKPKECSHTCESGACSKFMEEVTCNSAKGEVKQIKGPHPEDPCCNEYECACPPVPQCCELGDAPTCSSPSDNPCEVCEAKLVQSGCCQTWTCECRVIEITDKCVEGSEVYEIDEYFWKNPSEKCQRCQCKKELVDGQVKAVSRCDPRAVCAVHEDAPSASFQKRYPNYNSFPECFIYRDFTTSNCCTRRIWSCSSSIEGCTENDVCKVQKCGQCEPVDAPECGPTQDLITGTYAPNPKKPECLCNTAECKCNPKKCNEPSKCDEDFTAVYGMDASDCCEVLKECIPNNDVCTKDFGYSYWKYTITFQIGEIYSKGDCVSCVCGKGNSWTCDDERDNCPALPVCREDQYLAAAQSWGYYSSYSYLRRRSDVCCPKYVCVDLDCYDEEPCYSKHWEKYIAGELYPYCSNGYTKQVKEVLDECCNSYECVCDECPDNSDYEEFQEMQCEALESYYNYWYFYVYGEKKYECGLKQYTNFVDSCGCKQPKECGCYPIDDPEAVCEISVGTETYTFSSNYGFYDNNDYCKTCYCNEWEFDQDVVDSDNALYQSWYELSADYVYFAYGEQAICFNDRAFCPKSPTCKAGEYYHTLYWGDCCTVWECRTDDDTCTDKRNPDECAMMFPDTYTSVPVCSEEEELDAGEYVDSENCCKIYTCQCKSECPLFIVDPPCMVGGTIELIPNYTKCGCPTKKCIPPVTRCVHNEQEYPIGHKWDQDNDVCMPCCCDAEGVATCEDIRSLRQCGGFNKDHTCAKGEKLVHVANLSTACCEHYTCEKQACETVNCDKTHPEHYPHTLCASGYKPETEALDECCSKQSCVCDTAQCGLVKLEGQHEKCEPGCSKTLVTNECGCEYETCTCTYCKHNEIQYPVGPIPVVDVCQPCVCNTDGTVECENQRKSCPADVTCDKITERRQLAATTECCSIYECVPFDCPTNAECENILGAPMVPVCEAGKIPSSTGKFLHSVTYKAETLNCCMEYECVCDTCPLTVAPLCDCNGGVLSESVDSCGCVSYTCSGCFNCEHEGIKYDAGDLFHNENDVCQPCCCDESGEVTCNNIRDTCVHQEAPTCEHGVATVQQVSEDGCCTVYECPSAPTCAEHVPDLAEKCALFTIPTCSGKGQKLVELESVCYHENDCCCPQFECQCEESLCVDHPPVCPAGQSYKVTRRAGECCASYSTECFELPCMEQCDSTTTCDNQGTIMKAGEMIFHDDIKCLATKCTCEGSIIMGNFCDECVEQAPVCGPCCHHLTCSPADEAENKCKTHSSCICDSDCTKQLCKHNGLEYPIGHEWTSEDACDRYTCVLVNGKVPTVEHVPTICQDLQDCAAIDLCYEDSFDGCCHTRTCKNCCDDVSCPAKKEVTCNTCSTQVKTQRLTHYLKNDNKCPCFEEVCECGVCGEVAVCPLGEIAAYETDACGCCQVLKSCTPPPLGCEHNGQIVPIASIINEVDNSAICLKSWYVCTVVNGEYKFHKHTNNYAGECARTAEELQACQAGFTAVDSYHAVSCCHERTCQPESCPPQADIVSCNCPTMKINTVITHYLGNGDACFKKECVCDAPEACAYEGSCAPGCSPVSWKEWTSEDVCGCATCKKMVEECYCPEETTTPGSPPPSTPTPPPQCVDETGCARALGEQWYNFGDACHTCSCLENGLISCNDRSAICMDVPSCSGDERLLTYACDECCLTYECVEDKCVDACLKIEAPCCESHEKTIRLDREDENGCLCPEFICVCDAEKCPPVTCENMECGGCGLCTPKTILGACDGTENGSDTCDTCTCDCEIPTCPHVSDISKCAMSVGDMAGAVCEQGLLCDGESMVKSSECPCKVDGALVPSGHTWKKPCSTCQCINGMEQCFQEQCSKVTCGKGYTAMIMAGACCETCEVNQQYCMDPLTEETYGCGAIWSEGCNQCECVETEGAKIGTIKCTPTPCADACAGETCFEFGHVTSSVREAGACCDSCNCVCDPATCDKPTILKASGITCESEGYELEWTTDGKCCPEPTCTCKPVLCVAPAGANLCINGVKLVKSITNACCPVYVEEQCGCEYNGQIYAPGVTTIAHESDACQTCECVAEGELRCNAVACAVLPPTCPNGQESTYIAPSSANGRCCGSYVCGKCTCQGSKTDTNLIQSYDGKNFKLAKADRCEHRITHDACNMDFEVIADFQEQIESFTIKDNVDQHVYRLTNDFVLTKDAVEIYELAVNSHYDDQFGNSATKQGDDVRLYLAKFELTVKYNPIHQEWSVSHSASYAQCTLGLCGTCDGDNTNDKAMSINPIRVMKFQPSKFPATHRVNKEDARCKIPETHTEKCLVDGVEYSHTETWDKASDDCYSCECTCYALNGSVACDSQCLKKDEERCDSTTVFCDGETIGTTKCDPENACKNVKCEGILGWVSAGDKSCSIGVRTESELTACKEGELAIDHFDGCCHTRECQPTTTCECPMINDFKCAADKSDVWTNYDHVVGAETCICMKKTCACNECVMPSEESCTARETTNYFYKLEMIPALEGSEVCCPTYECIETPKCLPENFPCNECESELAYECYRIYVNPYLDDCREVTDPYYYLYRCYYDLSLYCEDHEGSFDVVEGFYAGCEQVNNFAQQCSCDTGNCVNDWRDEYIVPYFAYGQYHYLACPAETCEDSNKEWTTCGPTVPKTCDNYQLYSLYERWGMIESIKQGCFCGEGLVLQGDKCVDPRDCHVCRDECGVEHAAGEFWNKDYCTQEDKCIKRACACDSPGMIIEQLVECNDEAVSCNEFEIKRVGSDATGCCTKEWCEPIKCAKQVSENCPEGPIGAACAFGEIEILGYNSDDTNNCCPVRTCECNQESCPLHYRDPVCHVHETLLKSRDSCCCCKSCVCDTTTCTETRETYEQANCVAGKQVAVVVASTGRNGEEGTTEANCCPQFKCVCNPEHCRAPVIEDCSVELGCFIEKLPISVDINNDEHTCCSGYDQVCVSKPELCPQAPVCDGHCSVLTTSDTECCPQHTCDCDASLCPVDNQETTCPAGFKMVTTSEVHTESPCSCCATIFKKECVCDAVSCPIPTATTCSDACSSPVLIKANYPATPTCCDHFECVCDATNCPSSDNLPCAYGMVARTLSNINVCDCCQDTIKCVCDVQPPLQSCPDCTRPVDTPVVGGCPGHIERSCIALDICQFEGKAYQPGTTWSPMGDMCTTCSCPSTPNMEGLFVSVCNTQCCGDCPMGHVRVSDSGVCCGMCVPLSCTDENNKERQIGDSWSASEDTCVQCTCKQGKRDIYAECFSTRKVMLEECPEEYIYRSKDGCVEECRKPVEQSVGGCAVSTDFVGRISVEIDGMFCETERDFEVNMCSGECVSSTVNKDGKMERQCSCCSATKTVERQVTVECSDGTARTHTVEFVEECSCGVTKCEAEKVDVPIVKPAPITQEEDESILDKAGDKAGEALKWVGGLFG